MTKVILKYRTLFFPFFLVIGSLYLNLRFAKLDPEIHHDGIIFPAAVAASEGLVPNRDFFTQYGPLGPIFQGFWIDLTSPTLINLRNLSAFLVTLSTVLVILLTYRAWGLFLSSLIATTSAIAYPTVLPAMLPWPTLITTNLILMCMLILQRIERLETNRHIQYLFYVIGVLLGIGFYVRLHLFAVFVSLAIALLIKGSKKSSICFLILGFANVILLMTLYQLKSNSLMQFIEQCILFPLGHYGGITKGTKATIVDIALFSMFFFYLILVYYLLRILNHYLKMGFKNFRFYITNISLLFVIVALYQFGRSANSLDVEDRSFINPIYLFLWICEHSRYLIAYSSVGGILLFTFSSLLKNGKVQSSSPLVVALGVGTLTQLYPSPDQLHVYWIAPITIAAISTIWTPSNLNRATVVLASSLILVQLMHSYNFLHLERFDYKAKIYLGMVGNDSFIDLSTQRVASFMIRNESFFHCPHGIYAAADGTYLPNSFDFVDWGPQDPIKEFRVGTHFACSERVTFGVIDYIWSDPKRNFFIWKQ